ncbi:helix-turn-helix domain-containing protein [Sphingomonas sp.]|uniref:helix-turn-helix domain-containing protein n=1 Tax=Sphingomonas sp. TaxID=28214 RepID=UPI0035BBFE0E
MTDVSLDYVVPSAALAPYVTLFYLFRADIPEFDDVERADHAQLRFRLSGGTSDYRFADGRCVSATPNHFVGATSSAVRTRADGPLRVFGMGLTPAGWEALTGIDAASALNRIVDAADRLGLVAADIAVALDACTTAEEMAAVAEPRLAALIGAGHAATLRFVRAVDAWLVDGPSPEIDALAAATGLSRRQVERRCNALYGAPPKLLARKYRALRAAVALADGHDPHDGFYDQSHMIREIKQFTGLTPRRMRDPGVLAKLTIAQRRALEGQVAPIISDT